MGEVYEAIDDTVDSIVAIKETFANTDKLRSAFEREAKLLANLKHAVLPRVMHHFLQGDRQFLVMEFVEGLNLAQLIELRGSPFKYETLLPWTDKLLDGLAYLHRQREPIIHRDIKPANIKLTNDGEIYLLDFGLAKGAPGQETSSVHGYTAAYAPLEQLNNSGTSAQSDLYSLGATLYHLLTGEPPISASKREEILENGDRDPLIPVYQSHPEVPEALSVIISQAMAMRRRDRFTSAVSMRQALHDATSLIQSQREQKILDTPTRPMENDPAVIARTEPALNAGHKWLVAGQTVEREDVYAKTIPGPLPVVPPPPSDPAQPSWPSRVDSEQRTDPDLAKEREWEEKRRSQAAEEEARRAEGERRKLEEEERLRKEAETRRRVEEASRKLAEQHAAQQAEEAQGRAEEQARRQAEEEARRAAVEAERLREEELKLQEAEARRKQDEEQARQQAEENARRQAAAQRKQSAERERAAAEEQQRKEEDRQRLEKEQDQLRNERLAATGLKQVEVSAAARVPVHTYKKRVALIALAVLFVVGGILTISRLAMRRGEGGSDSANPKPVSQQPGTTPETTPEPTASVASAPSVRQLTRSEINKVEQALSNGNAQRDAKRYALAETEYRRALLINPSEARAYNGLGNVFYDQGRYAEAIVQFKRAVEIDPKNAEAHYALGLTYLITNKKAAATTEYQSLKSLNSRYADNLLSMINKH
jgi:serine/threonine protein kinase